MPGGASRLFCATQIGGRHTAEIISNVFTARRCCGPQHKAVNLRISARPRRLPLWSHSRTLSARRGQKFNECGITAPRIQSPRARPEQSLGFPLGTRSLHSDRGRLHDSPDQRARRQTGIMAARPPGRVYVERLFAHPATSDPPSTASRPGAAAAVVSKADALSGLLTFRMHRVLIWPQTGMFHGIN